MDFDRPIANENGLVVSNRFPNAGITVVKSEIGKTI